MTFPTIPTTAANRLVFLNQLDTTATLTFPNFSGLTQNQGDLLIAIAGEYQTNAAAGAAFTSWSHGFTEAADLGGTTANGSFAVAYKWVGASAETGTLTVTRSGTLTGDASVILLSIPGAHATTPPEVSAIIHGTTAAADPPALNPSWGAADTLWIAVGGNGMTSITGSWTAFAAAPTGWTNYVDTAAVDTSVVGDFELAVAFSQFNDVRDPDGGAFNTDISNARNSAFIIAVRPTPNVVVTAATVAAVAAVPAVALALNANVSPSAIVCTTAMPAVTASGGGGGGGGGTITSRTATLAESASATSITGTLPSDKQTGDLVVATFYMSCTPAQFTGPGGSWTQYFAPTQNGTAADTIAAYYQFDPASGPVGTSSAVAGRQTCICQAYGGVDTGTPADVASPSTAVVTTTPVTVPSITTVTNAARVISGCVVDASTGTWTFPTGMTVVKNHTSGVGRGGAYADETFATAGATGTRAWAWSGAAVSMRGFLGALRPASGGGGTNATVSASMITCTASVPAVTASGELGALATPAKISALAGFGAVKRLFEFVGLTGTITGLQPGASYDVTIRAVDTSENKSADSPAVTVSTLGAGQTLPATIGAVAAMPAATATVSGTRTPAALAAATAIPAATATGNGGGSSASPATLAAVVAMPAVTATGSAGGTRTPATIVAVATVGAPSVSAGATVGRRLAWSDDFDGTAGTEPNCLNWRLDFYDEDGRLNSWVRNVANAQLDGNSALKITAIQEPSGTGRSYTSAQLKNQYVRPDLCPGATKYFQRYGRWEVRAKLPSGAGIWTAPMWTMGDFDNTPGGWPECGEIDVIETINDGTTAHGHLHMDNGSGADYGPGVTKSGTWADGNFHTFAVEWTASQAEWFADGVSYGTITRATAEGTGAKWPFDDKPQSPIISLAVGGWAGAPSGWTSLSMYVDYVRIYEGVTFLSALSATTSFPTATATASSTVSPATLAATTAIGTPTVLAGGTRSPATIAATTALGTATATVGGVRTPATITATTAIPAVTTQAGGTRSPATIAAVTAVPAVSTGGGAVVNPATITSVAAMGAVIPRAGSTRSPAVIVAVATIPAVTSGVSGSRSPAVVAGVASIGSATITFGGTASPSVLAAIANVPGATATGAGNRTPAVIVAVAAIGAATLQAGGTRSPSVLVALAALPAVVASGNSVFVYPGGPWEANPGSPRFTITPSSGRWSTSIGA